MTFLRISLFFVVSTFVWAQTVSFSYAEEDAHFVVTDEVVNADLRPFTATIGSFGNGSRLSAGSGFEPIVFRTMFKTRQASANRLIASNAQISNFDSWRTGALDGADVEILRIENGEFRTVRQDRIAAGGFQASSWIRVTPNNRVVAGGQTSFEFSWANFNRPGVPYYFTVQAVDRRGRFSDLAQHIMVMAPDIFPARRPQTQNTIEQRELTSYNARLAPPQNLQASVSEDGLLRLDWSPSSDATGYIISVSYTHLTLPTIA